MRMPDSHWWHSNDSPPGSRSAYGCRGVRVGYYCSHDYRWNQFIWWKGQRSGRNIRSSLHANSTQRVGAAWFPSVLANRNDRLHDSSGITPGLLETEESKHLKILRLNF